MTPKLGTIEEERAACIERWKDYEVGTLAHCLHSRRHFEVLIELPQTYIKVLAGQPTEKQSLLYRLFSPWTGIVSDALQHACNAYSQARDNYCQVDDAFRSGQQNHAAWQQAYDIYRKAEVAFLQAEDSWQSTPEFLVEHARLFPDCTWIFPWRENKTPEEVLREVCTRCCVRDEVVDLYREKNERKDDA